MALKKTLLFLDFANINRAAQDEGVRIDYALLKQHIGAGRELLDAYCYAPLDPRNEHKYDNVIEELERAGYFVTTKVGAFRNGTYKCNMDIEITIDLIKMAHVIRPDIMVLASGDGDFIAVISELRKMAIRVEVASFKATSSKQLLLKSSAFIDIGALKGCQLKGIPSKQADSRA